MGDFKARPVAIITLVSGRARSISTCESRVSVLWRNTFPSPNLIIQR
jgi:hypothetical protein